jgi:hypothetical protein
MIKRLLKSLLIMIFFGLGPASQRVISKTLPLQERVRVQVQGTVVSQGAPLPGVWVTLISKATGESYSVTTDASGKFYFNNAQPGMYALKAEVTGFKTVTKENIDVRAGIAEALSLKVDLDSLDERGGITGLPTLGKGIGWDPSKNKIPERTITLAKDFGLDPIKGESTNKEKASFYYSQGKLFAKKGAAKVGFVEKQLKDITEIPFKDEFFIRDGLAVENKCVYAIRIGDGQSRKILLVRVLHYDQQQTIIEFYFEDSLE